MGGIVELLANALGVVKEFFGFQSKRLDLKNAQDVKDAAIKRDEQRALDKSQRAVADGDLAEIRKELSE